MNSRTSESDVLEAVTQAERVIREGRLTVHFGHARAPQVKPRRPLANLKPRDPSLPEHVRALIEVTELLRRHRGRPRAFREVGLGWGALLELRGTDLTLF